MDKSSAPAAVVAALSVLAVGVLLGTVVGDGGDQEGLGSQPTEIATGKRLKPVPLLPASTGIPPLKTTAHESVQPVDEVARTESVYTPEPEYVPTAEEKTPYVPPPAPEPAPEVTVGKNE